MSGELPMSDFKYQTNEIVIFKLGARFRPEGDKLIKEETERLGKITQRLMFYSGPRYWGVEVKYENREFIAINELESEKLLVSIPEENIDRVDINNKEELEKIINRIGGADNPLNDI